jgi:hypothetical protein
MRGKRQGKRLFAASMPSNGLARLPAAELTG